MLLRSSLQSGLQNFEKNEKNSKTAVNKGIISMNTSYLLREYGLAPKVWPTMDSIYGNSRFFEKPLDSCSSLNVQVKRYPKKRAGEISL